MLHSIVKCQRDKMRSALCTRTHNQITQYCPGDIGRQTLTFLNFYERLLGIFAPHNGGLAREYDFVIIYRGHGRAFTVETKRGLVEDLGPYGRLKNIGFKCTQRVPQKFFETSRPPISEPLLYHHIPRH